MGEVSCLEWGGGWGVNEAERRNEIWDRTRLFHLCPVLVQILSSINWEPCSGTLPQESPSRSPVLGSVKQDRKSRET